MCNFFFLSVCREIQDLALALQVVQTTHILGMMQVFSLQKLSPGVQLHRMEDYGRMNFYVGLLSPVTVF